MTTTLVHSLLAVAVLGTVLFLGGCAMKTLEDTAPPSPVAQMAVETTARIALRRYLEGDDHARKAESALRVLRAVRDAQGNLAEAVPLAQLRDVALEELNELRIEGKLTDLDVKDMTDLVDLFGAMLAQHARRYEISLDEPARVGAFLDALLAQLPK